MCGQTTLPCGINHRQPHFPNCNFSHFVGNCTNSNMTNEANERYWHSTVSFKLITKINYMNPINP